MKLFLTDPAQPERIRRPAPPAVFGLPVRTLSIASRWRSPATGALLAGEIGRKPANLHLHVQRISLWSKLDDAAATAAAIVDLWIVLGPHGAALRTRLLRDHYEALERHDLGLYLSARLDTGLDRHDPRIALPGAVLARPVEGARVFLHDSEMPSGSIR
ncbi:hypothetical protein [Zoogloea sp.]|uniref:hypothetical protein n=1 Tax=Zoogloea sp. TaxID=49181 RepID=UPI0035B3804C